MDQKEKATCNAGLPDGGSLQVPGTSKGPFFTWSFGDEMGVAERLSGFSAPAPQCVESGCMDALCGVFQYGGLDLPRIEELRS